MSFKNAKRGVDDLFYALSSSLEKFKGTEGLHRVMTAGRLSFLSFIGEFDKSRDEMFDQRSHCVFDTRHYLLKLTEQFASTVRAAEKLTARVAEICDTLEKFHQHCDLELEFEDQDYPGVNMAFEEGFREMKLLNQKIKSSFEDFSAAEVTCKNLNDAAVIQLQAVDAEVNKTVGAKQTEFDALRRRVQVKRTIYDRSREMYGDRDAPELMLAEMNLQSAISDMEMNGSEYVECVRGAMQATTFALEQTSMSTWSSANVFFLQLSQFLEEFSLAAKPLSTSFNSIKNAQKVSRRITQEKRSEAAANATRTAANPRGTPPPPLSSRSEATEPADGVVEHSTPPSPDSLWSTRQRNVPPSTTQRAPRTATVALRAGDAFTTLDDIWEAPTASPSSVQLSTTPAQPPRPIQGQPQLTSVQPTQSPGAPYGATQSFAPQSTIPPYGVSQFSAPQYSAAQPHIGSSTGPSTSVPHPSVSCARDPFNIDDLFS